MKYYNVIQVPVNARDTMKVEQLGTKEKFWFFDEKDETLKLFKVGRPKTGENWSEKVTSELAKLLSLPCAEYEFAVFEKKEGVVSPSFVPESGRLVHGNEILAKFIDNYPESKSYKVREHKLIYVLAVLRLFHKKISLELPIGYKSNLVVKEPLDVFVGYLLFDCWISNPDRHHENWGLIMDGERNTIHLAPTYDHASGLGCRESDKTRVDRMNTKDDGYKVKAFVKKAKSEFYDNKLRQLKTINAFSIAANKNSKAADFWLEKLESISKQDIADIFQKVPEHLISNEAISFAIEILHENKKRLLNFKQVLQDD